MLLFSPTGEGLNLSHFSADFLKGPAFHAVSVRVIVKTGYQPFHHQARDPKERESRRCICLICHLINCHKVHTIQFPKESMKLSLTWTREAFLHERGREVSFSPLATLAYLKLISSILARGEWDLQRSWNCNDARSRGSARVGCPILGHEIYRAPGNFTVPLSSGLQTPRPGSELLGQQPLGWDYKLWDARGNGP